MAWGSCRLSAFSCQPRGLGGVGNSPLVPDSGWKLMVGRFSVCRRNRLDFTRLFQDFCPDEAKKRRFWATSGRRRSRNGVLYPPQAHGR